MKYPTTLIFLFPLRPLLLFHLPGIENTGIENTSRPRLVPTRMGAL